MLQDQSSLHGISHRGNTIKPVKMIQFPGYTVTNHNNKTALQNHLIAMTGNTFRNVFFFIIMIIKIEMFCSCLTLLIWQQKALERTDPWVCGSFILVHCSRPHLICICCSRFHRFHFLSKFLILCRPIPESTGRLSCCFMVNDTELSILNIH